MSGSRNCKERKGRSCCLGMSRVAKYSEAARLLCPSPLLPLRSRALAACGLSRHHLPSQLPACHPACPCLASPHLLLPLLRLLPLPQALGGEPQQGQRSEWGWAGWASAPWGAGWGGQWAGSRRAWCQGRALRTGAVWGLCAESRVSWGAALWGAGPQGLGVGEPGGGARGLWRIHVCIW